MTKRPRKTPPPFTMTPLLLEEAGAWALKRAMRLTGEEIHGELSPAEKELAETALRDKFQREVVGDMVEPPAMDGASINRAYLIKSLAHYSLDHGKDFEEVLGGFRSVLEENAVKFRLKWLWPPVEDQRGNVSVSPPPRASGRETVSVSFAEQVIEESAGKAVEAYQFLFLHYPTLLDQAMKVRERSPELVTLAVVQAYEKMLGRRGRRKTGPTARVTTRVLTIEALRELCNLSQADGRRLWYHWFTSDASWEESGGQYGEDLRTVVRYARRHMVLEATTNRSLTEQEIQEMVQRWRAIEKS